MQPCTKIVFNISVPKLCSKCVDYGECGAPLARGRSYLLLGVARRAGRGRRDKDRRHREQEELAECSFNNAGFPQVSIYTIHYIIHHTVECSLSTVLYIPWCMYSINSAQDTLHFILCTIHFTLQTISLFQTILNHPDVVSQVFVSNVFQFSSDFYLVSYQGQWYF